LSRKVPEKNGKEIPERAKREIPTESDEMGVSRENTEEESAWVLRDSNPKHADYESARQPLQGKDLRPGMSPCTSNPGVVGAEAEVEAALNSGRLR